MDFKINGVCQVDFDDLGDDLEGERIVVLNISHTNTCWIERAKKLDGEDYGEHFVVYVNQDKVTKKCMGFEVVYLTGLNGGVPMGFLTEEEAEVCEDYILKNVKMKYYIE